ncbi:MAG: DUF177 domain-containing protein [Moorella sp. (in: Bacteria)]|nr:DUF177 domain-containing protein [Moorella sp. (in: firmicutes)]
MVKGQVATTLELTCDRCLDVFRYSILAPLEEEYAAAAGFPAATADGEGRETRPLEGDFINLKLAVEETLILALPMKQLCRENCEGLCPRCGCNLNTGTCRCEKKMVDPRLVVLEELLLNNNDNNDATR